MKNKNKVFSNRTLTYEKPKRMVWTDEFIGKVTTLLKEGYTYPQIGKMIDLGSSNIRAQIAKFRLSSKWVGKIPYIKMNQRPLDVLEADRIGILDIEVYGGFNANRGFMLAYTIKEHDKDKYFSNLIEHKQIRKGNFDKILCEQIVKDILKFDVIVGYYSGDRRFDIPYIRTRCAHHEIKFPFYNTIKQIDLYVTIKNKFKLDHSTLREACRIFNLKEKGFVDFRDWESFVYSGDMKMGRKILDYNVNDTKITDQLYNAVMNYDSMGLRSI